MGYGFGFGHGFLATGAIVLQLFIAFIAFAVVAGLVFLLVRFLLVATRAAQIYVNKNDDVRLPAALAAQPAPPADLTPPAPPVGAEDIVPPATTKPDEEPPAAPSTTRPKKPKA
ncbi:hypothetical protein FB562_0557 [Homoserinimonas aerilata]|uniref:Uncharacterized protein n=1 Tax=Homoserinimonas aerilata TaxID=1162970 RepID=A0A542YHP9_9MICO|nr:hypothetical protein [Homoserinimonas aerilata]TQL47494.1 hypothetical protein FB562_0557 [Homoserinimonas aerilata]